MPIYSQKLLFCLWKDDEEVLQLVTSVKINLDAATLLNPWADSAEADGTGEDSGTFFDELCLPVKRSPSLWQAAFVFKVFHLSFPAILFFSHLVYFFFVGRRREMNASSSSLPYVRSVGFD